MRNRIKSLIISSMMFTSLSLIQADEPFFPKLVVSGSSQVRKPSDLLTINISVVTQGDTAVKALSDNNGNMSGVIESLKRAGLEKGEYQTGQFSIQPMYSIPPKNPPPDWKAVITGYEVTNTLNIITKKLDKAPAIIDAASKAGANKISNINFGLADPGLHKQEAIKAATTNAITDATALAEAANLKLIRVLNISSEQPQVYPRAKMLAFATGAGNETPIEAGDVEVNANVSITYEISAK